MSKNTAAPTALDTLVASAESLLQPDITTEAELERRLTSLKKAYVLNSQLRVRYAHEPARFLQSELSLDDAIRALAPVAVCPQLYPSLIALGALQTLTSLLIHTNEDILYRTVDLLHDLTATDDSETGRDDGRELYDALLKAGIFAALNDVLDTRLLAQVAVSDADDDAATQEAVAQTFSIFENSLDARPDLAAPVAENSRIIQTCIKQINVPQPNSAAVELLAVLVQSSAECRKHFVEHNGINTILEALAPFRKRRKLKRSEKTSIDTETSAEQEEVMENMFGVLCCTLFGGSGAKSAFLLLEGVELMVSFMKSSKTYRGAATKVLEFACTGHAPAVQRLLACGGVGVVFAVLRNIGEEEQAKPGVKRRQRMHEDEVKGMTEHVFGIMFSMFRYASDDDRRRLLLKLREDGAGKTRRVVSLYRHFALAVENVIATRGRYLLTPDGKTTSMSNKQGDDGEEELEDKLEAGLLIVQMGAAIIGHVLAYGDEDLRKALSTMLPQVGLNVALICRTLEEYAGSLEGGLENEGRAKAEKERTRILDLVKNVRKSNE